MSNPERAYALLVVKSFDATRRTFSGVASTPELDRQGHRVVPEGLSFRNPLPLLFFHDQKQPLGVATLYATKDGIGFDASLATVEEPGKLRDRIDEAWQSIRAGLMRGVSIGFHVIGDGIKFLRDGTAEISRAEVVELSLVTVPANQSANILTVKSLAAATGLSTPGDSGLPIVRAEVARYMKLSTQEQIKNFDGILATKSARMAEIMAEAGDATLSDVQTKEYDGLRAETKSVEGHLERLRDLEKLELSAATRISNQNPQNPRAESSDLRGGIVQIKSNVPKGTAFVRYAMCMFRARGDSMRALDYAKQWKDSTPEVELLVKAAVAPGDTINPAWAGALVTVQNATNEFLELLRPATIIGKIPNLRQVPFVTQVPLQTGGGTYMWVGQGAAKPVGKLALTTANLNFSKAAGIIVITDELAKLSNPSAEQVVRNDMVAGIAAFLDSQFIDPAVALVANISPASITNGAGTAASSDSASADLATILGHFSSSNIPLAGITLIMSEGNALAMGMLRDANGNKVFPSMSAAGGSAEGFSVIASNAAGQNVIGLSGPNILFADEGGIQIDVSREASVIMDSDPANAVAPVLTSLWQNNLVGLRAERMINWLRARLEAVYYVTGATYTVT
jgi:HK97 family phage major capsid protein/HK97 family phage prohead protease